MVKNLTRNSILENTENLLKKIKKLLSLATSDNENEARLAAEKAQELMVRYNLDLQQVTELELDSSNQNLVIEYQKVVIKPA